MTEAAEIVRRCAPVFEMVSTLLWLLPTVMLPKLRLPGAVRYPGPPAPVPAKVLVMVPE